MPDINVGAFHSNFKEKECGESIELNNCEGKNSDTKLQKAGIVEIGMTDERKRVTLWSFVFPIFGIIFHIGDVGSDVYLAIKYLSENKILYSICTITFVFLPTIVNMLINFRMFERKKMYDPTSTTVSWKKKGWISVLLHLFHLAPIFYNFNSIRYAHKSRNYEKEGNRSEQRRYYAKMNNENEELALFKIVDGFFEAAPQLILQLTILLIGDDKTGSSSWMQISSLCTSFISMGLTLVGYNRSIRLAQDDQSEMSIFGLAFQFLWHLCIIVSRIISISTFASKWPIYTVLGCFVHWAAMSLWLILKPYGIKAFCANKNHQSSLPLTLEEKLRCALFAAVLGIVYIFTHLNPGENKTFKRHLVYYIICGVENGIAIFFWARCSDESVRSRSYFLVLIGLCIGSFILGIIFMVLYYKRCHPTLKRQTSTPELMHPLSDCGCVVSILSLFVLCHST